MQIAKLSKYLIITNTSNINKNICTLQDHLSNGIWLNLEDCALRKLEEIKEDSNIRVDFFNIQQHLDPLIDFNFMIVL